MFMPSFGLCQPQSYENNDVMQVLVWNDPVLSIYREIVFNNAGTLLLGGALVGDENLIDMSNRGREIDVPPSFLLIPLSS